MLLICTHCMNCTVSRLPHWPAGTSVSACFVLAMKLPLAHQTYLLAVWTTMPLSLHDVRSSVSMWASGLQACRGTVWEQHSSFRQSSLATPAIQSRGGPCCTFVCMMAKCSVCLQRQPALPTLWWQSIWLKNSRAGARCPPCLHGGKV